MWRAALILLTLLLALPANAQDRYASIIVDADTLNVLHARQIDAERIPASLTKVMTLYVTFEAIERDEIGLADTVTVSAHAARTPPVKMGLRKGQAVTLDTLVQAVAVRSSNDAAVAIAEAVGGTEAAFVDRMNASAAQLGMSRTTFRNPHGLPNAEQRSTARDMAKLAHATLTRFPQHYRYFGQREFRGRKNTNGLLVSRRDVDGFKTGYTRASGHNLIISAARDMNGQTRRLIAVVMGGASKGTRDTHMSDLVDRGWDVMAQMPAPTVIATRPMIEPQTIAAVAAEPLPIHWAVQIHGFDSPAESAIHADTLVRRAGQGEVVAKSGFRSGRPVHAVRVEGLTRDVARGLCAEHGSLLGIEPRRCMVLSVAKSG